MVQESLEFALGFAVVAAFMVIPVVALSLYFGIIPAIMKTAEALAGHRSTESRRSFMAEATDMVLATPAVEVATRAGVGGELLKEVDIFRTLSDEQRGIVAGLGRVERWAPGAAMGEQGSYGGALYVLLSGQVELVTSSPMGQLTVRVAGPGETLPLAALLGSGRLITTPHTLTDVRAMMIPREQLLMLCDENPSIGMKIFQAVGQILADRYRSTLQRLTEGMDRALRQPELWANV